MLGIVQWLNHKLNRNEVLILWNYFTQLLAECNQ